MWHLVLRVSISPPPLATQCLYGKYHGQKTSPGQAKSFLMISWQSGRVVSGSHPRFCLPLPALSLRVIRASRLHSYAALFNSALGSPESPGSGAGFQPGLLLVPGPVGHLLLGPLLTTGCSPSGLILYLGVLWASGIRCGTSVLRVSISLPPLATQCLYGKYHGQKKPAPDRRNHF